MPLNPGDVLSHYRIVEKVGAGGMGEVYRAHDEHLERDVALKVLPAGTLADEATRKRFRREALALSKLNHPNIATVFDFDTQEGVDFLVMELVLGETLSGKLATGPLPEREVGRLGAQLAEGLAAAHHEGTLHRDIKPANLRVTPDGQLKILDFGLAKLVRTTAEATTQSLTEEGYAAGTLPYMSPEQLCGERVDERADLYAAGATLYEMATGKRAFAQTAAPLVTDAILHQAPVSPREISSKVSGELERIVLKCLEKEPEDRYQTARELAVDLRHMAGGTATRAAVSSGGPRRRGGVPAIALGVGAAIVLALVALAALTNIGGWRSRLLPRGHTSPIRSLAVLPLENFSHDPDQQYFADGMTEQLITTLAQIGALRVISRTSVMGFKGTTLPLPEIGRKLGVDAIVEGSVQRSGDRVRITAQLIRVASDKHMWAQSYERDLRDVLVLQDEVAGAIAKEVQAHLTPQQQEKIASTRPVSPRGYELYLRALAASRRLDPVNYQAALEFLKQAVKDDSTYAPAWAAFGLVYIWYNPGGGAHEEDVARARQAVERALALDSDLGLAHSVKAVIEYEEDWNWAGAEREFKRAIELTPNLFEAHHLYAHLLLDMGRVGEALEQSRIALALDPLNTIATHHMGWHYLYAGQIEQAIPEFQATLRLDPGYPPAQGMLQRAYLLTGRYDEAAAALHKYRELIGAAEAPDTLWVSAFIAARRGRTDEALRMISRLIDRVSRGEATAYRVAAIFAQLGRKDDAFQWLDRAIKKREDGVTGLKQDPYLAALRSDPRFAALLHRIGLPA